MNDVQHNRLRFMMRENGLDGLLGILEEICKTQAHEALKARHSQTAMDWRWVGEHVSQVRGTIQVARLTASQRLGGGPVTGGSVPL